MPSSRNLSRQNSLEFLHTSAPKVETAVNRDILDAPPAETDAEYNYFHTNPTPDYLPEIQNRSETLLNFMLENVSLPWLLVEVPLFL